MRCLSSLCIFLVILPATVHPQQETRDLVLIGNLPEEVLSLTKKAEVCTSVRRNGVIPTEGKCPERSISTNAERKPKQLNFHGKVGNFRRLRRFRQNNKRVRRIGISDAAGRKVRQLVTKRPSFSAVRVASRRSQRSKIIESGAGRKHRRLHRVQRFEGKRKFARVRRDSLKHFIYRYLGSTRIKGREQPRRIMRRRKNKRMERVMRHSRNIQRRTVNRKKVRRFERRIRNRIGRLSNRRRNNKERFARRKGRINMESMRSTRRGRRVVRRERTGRIVHLEKPNVGRTLRHNRNNIRHRTRRTRNIMGKNKRQSSYYGYNEGKEKALEAFEQENGRCKQRMIQRNSSINLTNDFNHSSKKKASTIGRTRLGTRFKIRCVRFRRVTEQPDQVSDVMGQKATLRHPRRQFAAQTSHQGNEIHTESETRENLEISWQKSNPHPKPVDNLTPKPENLQNDVITRYERETNIDSNIFPKYIMDGIQLLLGDAAGETYSGEVNQ